MELNRINFHGLIVRFSQLEMECEKLNINYGRDKTNIFKDDLVESVSELTKTTETSLKEAQVEKIYKC